jgi:hypothetical protein
MKRVPVNPSMKQQQGAVLVVQPAAAPGHHGAGARRQLDHADAGAHVGRHA